jgi:hypothetical protein
VQKQYSISPRVKTYVKHPRVFPGSGPDSSIVKASIVDALLDLSDVGLPLAIAWAHAIQRRWPGFRGA